MILKLKRDAGWAYLDQIEAFRTYGYVTRPGTHDGADVFETVSELRPAVEHTWGEKREFDRELWPDFPEDRDPGMVGSGVAHLSGGKNALVLWNDEAFLLSDDGKTIDRLR